MYKFSRKYFSQYLLAALSLLIRKPILTTVEIKNNPVRTPKIIIVLRDRKIAVAPEF